MFGHECDLGLKNNSKINSSSLYWIWTQAAHQASWFPNITDLDTSTLAKSRTISTASLPKSPAAITIFVSIYHESWLEGDICMLCNPERQPVGLSLSYHDKLVVCTQDEMQIHKLTQLLYGEQNILWAHEKQDRLYCGSKFACEQEQSCYIDDENRYDQPYT